MSGETFSRSYAECRAWAQKQANETGADFGIERCGDGWAFRRLPLALNRYGHDLACEVVRPE